MVMKISLSVEAGNKKLIKVDDHLNWPSQPHCNYVKFSKLCSDIKCRNDDKIPWITLSSDGLSIGIDRTSEQKLTNIFLIADTNNVLDSYPVGVQLEVV